MALDSAKGGPFTLTPLPFDQAALAPAISARTIDFHYNKHHKGYVDKLNELVAGTDLAGMSLEQVIKKTASDKSKTAVYNNAAQVWNHDLYWHSLSPTATKPSDALQARIAQDFGSLDALKEALSKAGEKHFASGWAWLVLDGGKLAVFDTSNADNPLTRDLPALLTVDVWEHAYYLDYQNARAKHLKAVITDKLNWDFASQQFDRAKP
jgi:Fe-Mn family superoxide dismutase